jgi:hypothetical protein
MGQAAENSAGQIGTLESTLKRLEKENKVLLEKVELSS